MRAEKAPAKPKSSKAKPQDAAQKVKEEEEGVAPKAKEATPSTLWSQSRPAR